MIDAVREYVGIDFAAVSDDAEAVAAAKAKGVELSATADKTWGNALYACFDQRVEEKLIQPTFITMAANHAFRTSSSSLKFSGYTAVYEEGRDEEKEEKESPLPALKEGETLALKDFAKDQHFTQPPAHYTDATLIRAMEEEFDVGEIQEDELGALKTVGDAVRYVTNKLK